MWRQYSAKSPVVQTQLKVDDYYVKNKEDIARIFKNCLLLSQKERKDYVKFGALLHYQGMKEFPLRLLYYHAQQKLVIQIIEDAPQSSKEVAQIVQELSFLFRQKNYKKYLL